MKTENLKKLLTELEENNDVYLHKHHIIPKHMGGSDEEDNLIELTVEDHAIAHKVLYGLYGRWQDKLAWDALRGRIDNENVARMASKMANKGNKRKKESIEKQRQYCLNRPKEVNERIGKTVKEYLKVNGLPKGFGGGSQNKKRIGMGWKINPDTGKREWYKK